MTFKTLIDPIKEHAKKTPKKPFLHHKNNNTYITQTYKEVYEKVCTLTNELKNIGLSAGEKIAIFSNNCPEWVISDLAILNLGAITIPIYPTLCEEDITHILKDANAAAIITQTQEMTQKVQTLQKKCPSLAHIITLHPPTKNTHRSFHKLCEKKTSQKPISHQINPKDIASIVYTSGTTGLPKGVLLTHTNILSNIDATRKIIDITSKDKVLSFLPLSHTFERTCGYYLILATGGEIAYAEDLTTIAEDIKLAKPTALVSVPRFYEKIRSKILDNLSGIKKPLFYWALKTGKAYYINQKRDLKTTLSLKLAKALVFSKVDKKLGGNIRFFTSGGAPLSVEVAEFYESLGYPMIQGYGMTEASPILACNRLNARKAGTVGLALPNVTLKLAPDGELLAKGPNITQGYYNLPEKTAELFTKDGWLKTGDIAKIDKEEFISIIDRKKELLVLSNGKNIAPLPLEEDLKSSRYIEQAIVIGDGHNFVSALIYPNPDQLKNKFKTEDINLKTLNQNQKIKAFYTQIIETKMAPHSNYERIKAFRFLPKELTEADGELTPTLKFKRKIIKEKYTHLINTIYENT